MCGRTEREACRGCSNIWKTAQEKYLGDAIKPIEPEDIKKANRLMYVTSVLVLVILES